MDCWKINLRYCLRKWMLRNYIFVNMQSFGEQLGEIFCRVNSFLYHAEKWWVHLEDGGRGTCKIHFPEACLGFCIAVFEEMWKSCLFTWQMRFHKSHLLHLLLQKNFIMNICKSVSFDFIQFSLKFALYSWCWEHDKFIYDCYTTLEFGTSTLIMSLLWHLTWQSQNIHTINTQYHKLNADNTSNN